MTYTVYGASLSPFVRKVRVFLAEKGLEYTLEQVNIFPAPDWFVEISPLKRIPVLRDESDGQNVTFPDSSVICAYLEKKEGGPALYPADPRDYGRALWLEEYCDSELAATAGMGVFRPIVVNKLMGKEPDRETADKTVAEKLPRFFDYLEKELTGREFAAGDAFSIADISIGTQFCNLAHAGVTPEAGRYPELTRYLAGIKGRPSFAACLEEEGGVLKALGF